MKETTYIFSSGTLKREDNTLLFITETGEKKFLPAEQIKEIYAFGEVNVNKRVLEFLAKKEIVLSYFNYYGYYTGSFYPREHYNSGYMILNQAGAYQDEAHRMALARKFVHGAAGNSLKILKYYNRREKDLTDQIQIIEEDKEKLEAEQTIETLMAREGKIKKTYYDAFNTIIDNKEFTFDKRTKRPPQDYINALISFANSMIYTSVLNEIYQTHLDPRIGYLHTTNSRRFTLNLDVAEIFKPVIGDRTIFSIINKGIITAKDFESGMGGTLLNEKGKRKFLEHFEERLTQTIKHAKIKKNVSYKRLMRLELYKLEKDIMGEEEYEPFIMEW